MICFQYESTFNFFTAGTMASKLSISVIKKHKNNKRVALSSDRLRWNENLYAKANLKHKSNTGAFMYMTFFSNSDDESITNADTDASQGILFVKATTYHKHSLTLILNSLAVCSY